MRAWAFATVVLLSGASGVEAQDPSITVSARLRRPADDVHVFRREGEAWLHLCSLPCELTNAPGDWPLGVGHLDGEPTAIDDQTVRVDVPGILQLTFSDREAAHGGGAVMIVIGAIVTGVGAALVSSRSCDSAGLECALDNSLMFVGGAMSLVVGPLLIVAGSILVALQPRASARWLPPED